MRGNLRVSDGAGLSGRSIPACAGEPGGANRRGRATEVYPRVCGGTGGVIIGGWPPYGLSPRVRGNLLHGVLRDAVVRSIPACAGEPYRRRQLRRGYTVYPRVCGGTSAWSAIYLATAGLSPRVRGNQRQAARRQGRPGSIPACAGEPTIPIIGVLSAKVYPRVCGGTRAQVMIPMSLLGLSPRVRGNPMPKRRIPLPPEVYPRVCGGTQSGRPYSPAAHGLSPRVRGNPSPPKPVRMPPRSIPACAGEPPGCRTSA